MNELKVIKITQGKIATNFAEFKKELSAQLETYKTVQVTEENLAERKKDRLLLTNSRKAMDKKRKEIKADYLKPLTEYEAEVKEGIEIIKEAELFIKDQTDRFDEEKREEKRKLFDDSINAELKDVELPSKYTDRIDMPSWVTNVATSNKKIIEEATNQVKVIKEAYETEQSNIMFVEAQVAQASTMAGLATPLTVGDVIRFVGDYETMDVATVTQAITNEAMRRKEAEEAAVRRAEEERLRREAEAKAKAEREEKARIEREAREKAEAERREQERIAREKAEKEESERLAKLEAEKVEEETKEEEFVADIDDFFETEKPKMYIYTVTIKTDKDAQYITNLLVGHGFDAKMNWEEA